VTRPALIGLGLTAMSLAPGAAPETLAHQAIAAALDDAGLTPRDVDGLLVSSSQGIRPERLGVSLAHHGGFGDLRLLEHIEIKGATAAAMVQTAVLAIHGGLATTVLCVFADAPLQHGGTSGSTYARSGGVEGLRGLERASGVLGSVPTYALLASRYLAAMGGTDEDLGAVACSTRAWAVGNPAAVARAPLDLDQYFASPMVSTPLRLLDCARPVNGAGAVVVSADDRARDATHPPVYVRGMAQWHPVRRRRAPGESWLGGDGWRGVDAALAMAQRTRAEVDVLQLYDPFSIVTLVLLEDYGFCEPGKAGATVRAGGIAPGGELPTNTGGGQLSGFYLQGMTPLAEGMVQVRGAGGDRQVAGAMTALVAGIGGRIDHHACLVLDRDPA
jgi:acetyl-CoA acetyltransferase